MIPFSWSHCYSKARLWSTIRTAVDLKWSCRHWAAKHVLKFKSRLKSVCKWSRHCTTGNWLRQWFGFQLGMKANWTKNPCTQREREGDRNRERERGQAVGVEKHSHLYWTWLKIRDVAVCNAFEKTVNKCAEVSAVGRWVLRNNFFVPFMTLHVCFKLQGWCFPPWSRGLLFKARCAAPRKPLAVWSFSAASFWLSVGSWSL